MSPPAKTSKAPAGLAREGRRLWRSIVAELAESGLELDARERQYLLDAARETDLAAELAAAWESDGRPMTSTGSAGQTVVHPLISEIRQHRETCARLLARLNLSDSAAAANPGHRYDSTSARSAAQTRWARRG